MVQLAGRFIGSVSRLMVLAVTASAALFALADVDVDVDYGPPERVNADEVREAQADIDVSDEENGTRRRVNDLINGQRVLRALDEIEVVSDAWDWLEDRRDELSRNVTSAGRNLDDWLAGEAVGERYNQSYLRLRLNQRVGRHNNYFSTFRISGRLDLPRASERWKLILESESQERTSMQQQRLDNIVPSSFSGGFRYELEERGGWRFNHDVGMRARLPIDPFYRFRSRYGRDLGEEWRLGVNHQVHYYHNDGWGQDVRTYFGRELSEDLLLRITTDVRYQHTGRRKIEFGQYVALHQSLGELRTLSYEAGVLGVTRPSTRIENYYGQVVYRRAIHQDWLVMELVPQLVTERSNSFKVDPRFQFNLEIYFFDF
jgi:hypothetical protein